MSNNNTKMPTRLAYLVCKRLNILTPKECQNVTYAQHMLMAIDSLRNEKFNINTWTLYYFVEKGIRHCDFFDILYSILLQGNTLEEAIDIVIDDYKFMADYVNSEFYDFMFAVDRESQYNELWSEWNSSLIHSSWEIGGGKVGHVSIMNEMREPNGKLIMSWVEEIPTTPNIQNWESCLLDNGQTFLVSSEELYEFLEETGFEMGDGTPNGSGCARHELFLHDEPTMYSVDVYTPFEWSSIGE